MGAVNRRGESIPLPDLGPRMMRAATSFTDGICDACRDRELSALAAARGVGEAGKEPEGSQEPQSPTPR